MRNTRSRHERRRCLIRSACRIARRRNCCRYRMSISRLSKGGIRLAIELVMPNCGRDDDAIVVGECDSLILHLTRHWNPGISAVYLGEMLKQRCECQE